MRKPILNICLIITLLIGLLAMAPTQPARADCAETLPDVWECDSTPQDADGLNVQDGDADTVTVNGDATVTNPAGDGIAGDDGDTVNNNGSVTGSEEGVLIDSLNPGATNVVTNTGDITGQDGNGIEINSAGGFDVNTVTNSGDITGVNGDGVIVYVTGAFTDSTVTNSGDIEGENGVFLGGASSFANNTVTNSGNVTGVDGTGIMIEGSGAMSNNSVTNSGSVSGQSGNGVFIQGNEAFTTNTVVNSGDITGEQAFGTASGVEIGGNGSSTVNTVINFGNISGDDNYGVLIDGNGAFATNSVTNYGNITGDGPEAGVEISGNGAFASNTVTNYGNVTGADTAAGISIGGGGPFNVNSVSNFGSVSAVNDGLFIGGGEAHLYNSGTIESVAGEAIDVEAAGSALIVNDGSLISQNGSAILGGGLSDGPMTLINNGTIAGNDTGPDDAVVDFWDGDDLIVNNGSIFTFNGSRAIDTEAGNDVVILGAGGVSYGTVCGDINVTYVGSNAAIVDGLMDGGDDTDTIIFGYLTPSQEAADAFAAEVAGYGPTASQTINGQDYSWANFENRGANITLYAEGTARLFDDGVLLAFAAPGGIAVCSGEAGFRAGTISFAELDNGQTTFSAGNDGWSVIVLAQGGGKYEVRLYDGSGVEHFNDANGDGLADSRFTFTR